MPLYKADPNNTGSQIPDIQGENRFDNLVNPNRVTFTKTPNYKLGDIIFINDPDRYSFAFDGIKVRKSTQYEFDKYEFNNFPDISCNAVIYKLLMSYY